MIQWVPARTGHLVPISDEIHLASIVDPELEAKRWVEKNILPEDSYKTFVVLGFGGGFHVRHLSERYPETKVLVVEKDLTLVGGSQRSGNQLRSNVHLISLEKAITVLFEEPFRSSLQRSYRVLAFAPCIRVAKQDYENVERLLLGRDWRSFSTLLQIRDDQKKVIRHLSAVETLSDSVSIRQIENHLTSGVQEPAAVIWKTLKELVV